MAKYFENSSKSIFEIGSSHNPDFINTNVRKAITGLTLPQEYVCIGYEQLHAAPMVTMTLAGDDFSWDVSQKHLFLGYKPLVIGIICSPEKAAGLAAAEVAALNFHHTSFNINSRWRGLATDKDCVAMLKLKRTTEKQLGDDVVIFYEGMGGEHHFISAFHRFMNRQRDALKRKPSGNVNLPGELHDMVRIAYAMPRIIPLITIGDGGMMNMFPTDLHGPVSKKFYISSLRIGGKANAQVERTRRLALSYIDVKEFRFAYALGKNHMQEMAPPGKFRLSPHTSATYGLPLPPSVLRYRELQQTGSFDAGIHRIHLYDTVHEEKIEEGITLAHIHQYYAQWRLDHGLPVKVLLR
jgi:hypothetical protein